MRKKATFQFFFDSSDEAEIVASSLSPELKQKIPKTSVNITQSDATLFITIQSNDLSSLRASVNSYLRWMNTAVSVNKLV